MNFGRTKILRDETEITANNVVQIVSETFSYHLANLADTNYLYQYYCGNQPILSRTKEIRPEICNKIVENRANEIVAFKTGYLCGEPLQYISRGDTENVSSEIGKLNDMMMLCGKSALDKELTEWMYIAGSGYRMILPNQSAINQQIIPKLQNSESPYMEDEAPFSAYTLDPRYCYVVYNSGLGEPPLLGVKYIIKQDGKVVISAYNGKEYFEFEAGILGVGALVPGQNIKPSGFSNYTQPTVKKFATGYIPIIEYPLNNARLGVFEIVLPILDAINNVQSNRLDGIEQFIQSLILLYNCDIDESDSKALRSAGLIKLKSVGDIKADLKILSEQLDQSQTQTLIDYMYQTVLNIVGMPNRNGGKSTSDTGAASLLRDGWESAEARAKNDELAFKESERQFLKIVLRIMRDTIGTKLKLSDIETKFTRRNYENITNKSQVLTTMLGCDKIAPILAFTHCGLFSDPEDAAKQSAEYYEKAKAEAQADAKRLADEAAANAAKKSNNSGGDAIA